MYLHKDSDSSFHIDESSADSLLSSDDGDTVERFMLRSSEYLKAQGYDSFDISNSTL